MPRSPKPTNLETHCNNILPFREPCKHAGTPADILESLDSWSPAARITTALLSKPLGNAFTTFLVACLGSIRFESREGPDKGLTSSGGLAFRVYWFKGRS